MFYALRFYVLSSNISKKEMLITESSHAKRWRPIEDGVLIECVSCRLRMSISYLKHSDYFGFSIIFYRICHLEYSCNRSYRYFPITYCFGYQWITSITSKVIWTILPWSRHQPFMPFVTLSITTQPFCFILSTEFRVAFIIV